MKVPTRSDRAHFPPPGFVTVYEFILRARLHFPPSPELINILTIYGVNLSQLSYRVMSIIIYIDEEHLFKVGLSTQAGKSHAQMLKKSVKVLERRKPSDYHHRRILKFCCLQDNSRGSYSGSSQPYIYDVEVKALEADSMEEGFIRGFMKGVRAVQHKTSVKIEGLTPSQAFSDPSSDFGGEEIENEL
ncbi:hypothetical protein IEQ34_017280 [Dendrobium chrysotoxum]|uniref:GIY-YIG homing endonuclease n=1 Tax=Dendrobium chrysotoxum TaxID=161865 RepID=A0AAV7G929_DENCH|nr:hypothetical protein IEQ34_017280 [Dendrobium chrysotoxum]